MLCHAATHFSLSFSLSRSPSPLSHQCSGQWWSPPGAPQPRSPRKLFLLVGVGVESAQVRRKWTWRGAGAEVGGLWRTFTLYFSHQYAEKKSQGACCQGGLTVIAPSTLPVADARLQVHRLLALLHTHTHTHTNTHTHICVTHTYTRNTSTA